MKKKYLLLILVLLFLVTGCGKKVYTCEKNLLDYNGMKIDRKVELTYNNKKIAKEVITVKYKTNSPKEHKKALENQYSSYASEKGINYRFEDTNDGFEFILEINMKTVNKDLKEELELYTEKADKAISSLKADGYICK